MSEQFRYPTFLRQEVKPGPLKGDEYGEGAFTIVGNLENLPEGVRKRMPEGCVVKQYRDWQLHPTGWIFHHEPDANMEAEDVLEVHRTLKRNRPGSIGDQIADEMVGILQARHPSTMWDKAKINHTIETWSLPGMAKKLQARQRKVQDYFGKELPKLVVPSQFIVGTGEDGLGHIYEVQEKIEPGAVELFEHLGIPVENFESDQIRIELIERLAGEVRSVVSKEKLADVKKELETFIRLAEQLPDREGWFPDLAPGNILFTKEGLRCIDTNYLVPLREGAHVQNARNTISSLMQSLRDLAVRL